MYQVVILSKTLFSLESLDKLVAKIITGKPFWFSENFDDECG